MTKEKALKIKIKRFLMVIAFQEKRNHKLVIIIFQRKVIIFKYERFCCFVFGFPETWVNQELWKDQVKIENQYLAVDGIDNKLSSLAEELKESNSLLVYSLHTKRGSV